MDVFFLRSDTLPDLALWHGSLHGSAPAGGGTLTWNKLEPVPGQEPNPPRVCAVSRTPDVVDVFIDGSGDSMYTASWTASAQGGKWSPWRKIGASFYQQPVTWSLALVAQPVLTWAKGIFNKVSAFWSNQARS